MRIAVGIDPSIAHTGVCRLRMGVEDSVTELTMETGMYLHRPARLAVLRERLRMFLQEAAERGLKDAKHGTIPALPIVVAMETEIWMGAGHTASESAAVQAIFQVLIWEMRVQWEKAKWPTLRFLPVNVSQVKKWVEAKEKQHVLMKVLKLYDREFTNDNMADAYVLAKIADAYSRIQLEPKELPMFPQRQQEVLKKLSCPWESPLVVQTRKKKVKKSI